MIEFEGKLTGTAEKYYYKKVSIYEQNAAFICLTIILPMVIQMGRLIGNVETFFIGFCSLYLIVPFAVRIPKSAKEKNELTPQRIYIEGEYIFSVSEKLTEKKALGDVKLVRDYGEFYEIVFAISKMSNRFICQKQLLKTGALQEFEELFAGKILAQ